MSDSEEPVLPSSFPQEVIDEVVKNGQFSDHRIKIKFTCGKGENYIGEIYTIHIIDGKDENKKAGLIFKTASPSPALRQFLPVAAFYGKEYFSYSDYLPNLCKLQDQCEISDKFHYAKFYKGNVDEFNEFLLMEDLNLKGFSMHDAIKPLDYDHAKLAITKLANYHALTYVLKDKNPKCFEHVVENTKGRETLVDDHLLFLSNKASILDLLSGDALSIMTKYYETVDEQFRRTRDSKSAAPYNAICHGDPRANNFLYSYKDGKPVDLIFVDWQLVKHASPITDLSYLLLMSTNQELRAKHYEEFLEQYYETLSKRVTQLGSDITKCYPRNVYEQHLKDYMCYGLIMAMILINLVIPNKNTDANLENSVFDSSSGQVVFSEECKSRMRGIMEDCIRLKLI